MQCKIDIINANKHAACFCENILQNPLMRYSTSNGTVEYPLPNITTADEFGALLLLSKHISLSGEYSSYKGSILGSVYAYQHYQSPNGKISIKKAAQLLKRKTEMLVTGIYNEYPVFEFEKMMIDPA